MPLAFTYPHGVLIDLAGVLYDGKVAYPCAAEAVERLHAAGLPVRYVTNTTRQTSVNLLARLRQLGLPIEPHELFTAPGAAKALLRARGLRPMLLIHPDLQPEFADLDASSPNAVVVGDAGGTMSYATLNAAFRLLMDGGQLIAMANNRYFRDPDGLSLDAGPFVAALEFASELKAEIVGKPAPAFFQLGLSALQCGAADAVMIGDDVRDDVCGAAAAGLRGILVRTGKYRAGDESQLPPSCDIAGDFNAAVDLILGGARAN